MVKQVSIRMAQEGDAEALAALTTAFLGPYTVNWLNATGDWMVAEASGKVVGCLQLCIGRPIGRLEMLCVQEDLDPRSKHAIMLELARGGMFALKQMGSQIITVFVAFESKGFKRMIKKRFGGKVTNSGNLLTAYLGSGA